MIDATYCRLCYTSCFKYQGIKAFRMYHDYRRKVRNRWLRCIKWLAWTWRSRVRHGMWALKPLKVEMREQEKSPARGWKAKNICNMDETWRFWRGIPEKTLSQKGKRCTGGKQATQKLTWVFSVNEAGEKEDPVVIVKSADAQCFKNLKDGSHPHKCSYYANKKTWMTTEVMTDILCKLNGSLKRHRRQILLFMDNAPCHPESHNINVVFLPKNTTTKT